MTDDGNEPPRFDEEFLSQYDELDEPGQPRLIQQLVERCLVSAPERLAAIGDAIAKGEAARVRHEAHALKSIVGNVGATTLVKRCHLLEKKGEMGLLQDIESAYQALVAEYEAAAVELRRRFL